MNEYGNMGASDPRLYDASQTIEADNARRLAEIARDGGATEKAHDVIQGVKEEALVRAWQSGKRAFVSPTRVKGSYMVKPGRMAMVYAGTEQVVVPGAQAGASEQKRLGDVKAVFQGNVLIVDPTETIPDPFNPGSTIPSGQLILAWAESHPEICRDAQLAETEIWAAFKQGQLNLAGREPSIPVNINVDKVLAGDYSGFNESNSIAARARKRLAVEAAAGK